VTELRVVAPDGAGEVRRGDDLAALLVDLLAGDGALEEALAGGLADGDVVLVTSKVVSKAEGRVVPGTREEALPAETARLVARRGPTRIVRTHHGLTLAAAGIDASNVEPGTVVLLPVDPDASARALRRRLHALTGRTVGVVVTDTAGRAWREGQTDLAVGSAGLRVLEDFSGRRDGYGNDLVVTAPAVADELAGAAELAQGKLGGRPFAVVRGRADLVLPLDDDGPGAVALVRAEGADMFGFGAREAVLRALRGDPADRTPFGAPASTTEMAEALTALTGVEPAACPDSGGLLLPAGTASAEALRTLAFAHGWELAPTPRDGSRDVLLRPHPGHP
jgi:coenzyme F420-0:L-glutamate ligase/coenzyme F420-1:gamma-L-glutamate ligase